MRNQTAPHNPAIQPALVNEPAGAEFLSLSRRGFRQLVERGEIHAVRIPGMRRVAHDVGELRSLVKRWKADT